MTTARTTTTTKPAAFAFQQDAVVAVLMAVEPCTDPSSPWHGELVVPAHVGDGSHVGPFGNMVDLSEALAIVQREDAEHHWAPDTGALVSTSTSLGGFTWTFPTITIDGH